MRKHTKILTRSLVLAVVAALAACNGTIDSEPNVILEVENMNIAPITGAIDSTTGNCAFTVTNASATFKNKPKNALAEASPFNDIILQSVTVTYVWDNGFVLTNRVFGLGGTVPANGSSSGNFSVINAADLIAASPNGGNTASLALVFRGVTVSGDAVSVSTGGTMTVNTCQ
jgi:hypothetical protein